MVAFSIRSDVLYYGPMTSDLGHPTTTLAPPFNAIFQDEAEAHWGFDFLRHTLDLLKSGTNDHRPVALTVPKSHKARLLRFNYGPWLLIDYCGPTSTYGKRINLALIADDQAVDPRKKWLAFNYPHDWRGVAIYKFTWPEIQQMDAQLTRHYAESMAYTAELLTKWKGSPYRLAHQPQIFAGIFEPAVRADFLQHGLDPFYVHRLHNPDGEI